MTFYTPPDAEYEFILNELLKLPEILPDYDAETTRFMLETAGNFAAKELASLYEKQGVVEFKIEDSSDFGQATLAEGYQQAYETFIDTGLQGIVADPAYGEAAMGQTHVVGAVIDEILHSANGDFALIPTLTHSAYLGIYSHGTEAQKQQYLPDLASGLSSGIMAMTEPSAGSDLSNVRTFAEPQGDGGYALHGQKIYISGGDNHYTGVEDAGNITHVVLAKVKDAQTGELDERVSMFIASKILVDESGNRTANKLGPIGIEHKMGMHGSATCTMLYKGAKAELIGERGKGIATMFAVMNEARNHVARQALGCMEAAYQKAHDYATNPETGRRMGRAATGAVDPDKPADLISVHAPVRKLLNRMRVQISGARMFQLDTALQMDLAKTNEESATWVSLMTNVVKSHITELGSEVTDHAIQVYGGMGYVEETAIARHYRDVRVTRIYEGTNQIQAVTLWRQMKHLPIWEKRLSSLPIAAEFEQPLKEAIEAVKRVAEALTTKDYAHFTQGAEELLEMLGITTLAWYHARAAALSEDKHADATFYYAQILPDILSLEKRANP